ncbi:MAG: hypothetical protein EPO13_04310 [Actinomycetota bacterium]|nr:MAG: hypothetical protein EPO13_04310 [Actinomycetota bacterium]
MSSASTTGGDQGWDHAVILHLLTDERFASYRAGRTLDGAFALYEWNMVASAAVMTTTGMVEVIVRNALDRQLAEWAATRHSGASWLDVIPLDPRGQDDLRKARRRAGGLGASHGKVIAELTFGFWRYLVASRYFTALWVPQLHEAFPAGASDLRRRRKDVEHLLQEQQFVRNRAAHHEPIHRRNLQADFDGAVRLCDWIHPQAAAWVASKSSLPAVIAARPTL